MKPTLHIVTLAFGMLLLSASLLQSQQTDTSSYFPLGLWGIWIDLDAPPFTAPLNANQWANEQSNWSGINGNYLVYWIPRSVEDTVMDLAESINYRIDVADDNYGLPHNTNSLVYWLYHSTLGDSTTAISQINNLKNKYGSRPGFFSYSFGQEGPVDYPVLWPGVGFLTRKIHELDPQRKSYMLAHVPLVGFLNAAPALDIYESEDYPFYDTTYSVYSSQQSRLSHLASLFDSLKVLFRGRHTEWHFLMQAHRENRPWHPDLRRPTFYELRAQVYLALSRGARGITSFVYGSDQREGDVSRFVGLVDESRNPFTLTTDPEGIEGFANLANVHEQIRVIGPTLRKLKVYEAFPRTSIPSGNAARIVSVSGDKIEIGTFKRIDQGNDSTAYFMLVNRVCNNENGSVASSQNITVTFGNSVPWEITEVASGSSSIINIEGDFAATLQPGDGKLYKIGALTSVSGSITSSTAWSGKYYIASSVTVNSGITLTISAGSYVCAPSGASLICNGSLYVAGSAQAPVTMDVIGSGTWGGIYFQSGSGGSVSYATLRYATKGIRVASSSPVIQHCTIEGFSEQGIYITNGSPSVQSNLINGWSGTAHVGTGIYVDNSGIGSSTLAIFGNNTVKGCITGISIAGPFDSVAQNTIGTYSGGISTSNDYGIVRYGGGIISENKVYGDNDDSQGILLWSGSGGSVSAIYNLLDHHGLGLIDEGWQSGSVTHNSFTNNSVSFLSSDGEMEAHYNDFWDSEVTSYNIWLNSDPPVYVDNNFLESWKSSSDPKYYDCCSPSDQWYPALDDSNGAGPSWRTVTPKKHAQDLIEAKSSSVPTSYAISAYPNPFNPSTTIVMDLPEGGVVSLKIFDALGRQVSNLLDGFVSAGRHQCVWNGWNSQGNQVSSGVYFLKMETAERIISHKLLLAK